MRAFIARLKDRKVIRVTVVYAVTGYAVFQVAANMFPALNLPGWTVTLVAVLFLVGFPIAALLSYAFEWTAEGLRRAPPEAADAPTPRIGWLNWLLVATTGAVLLAVAGFYVVAPLTMWIAGRASAPAASIAVLPFVSMSDAPDDEHFADGLTEELINELAQLPDLAVAGRTSSFYFKGRNENLREMGRALGVAHVLEGSVRRAGENLRVTAQLIKVSDGFHLWSEVFDSRMSDAIAIQTAIARAVAERLEARLLRAPGADRRDARAFQLELIARSKLRKQELDELQAARQLYRELIELEPDNADALAGFAEATMFLAQGYLALDFDQARRESETATDAALRLDRRSSEAWRVRGFMHRVLAIRTGEQRHADAALDAFQRAVELDPRNADALAMLAAQFLDAGQVEQAAATIRRSLEIDPLSRRAQQLLGNALERQGRLGEARRQYETLIELFPDYTSAKVRLGRLLIDQGKLDEAVRLLDDRDLIDADPYAGFLLANCFANLEMPSQMQTTLEGIREPRVAAALAQTILLLAAGRREAVRELAERELVETNDPVWRSVELLLAVLAEDPVTAGAALEGLGADSLAPAGVLDRSSATDTLLITHALRLTGEAERAERLLETLLERFATAPGEYVPNDVLWIRALTAGALGRVDVALDALERAADQGFRTLTDFEYFLRAEDYPFAQAIARHPRYAAITARIEAENARIRQALLAGGR